MKATDFLTEADTLNTIKRQNLGRRIAIAFDHDRRLPEEWIYRLHERFTTDQKIEMVAKKIDEFVENADLPTEYIPWILSQYINGWADLEDIGGEIVDMLAGYHQLKIRNILSSEKYRNINNFNWGTLRSLLSKYRTELQKIRNQQQMEKMKRTAQQIVLLDNDRFLIQIPVNFGSCYVFNNLSGVQGRFCTGSSSGPEYFARYSKDGPLIQVYDKNNSDDVDGKWQIHAATNQIKDAQQSSRGNEIRFARLFPGLLKVIGHNMMQRSKEIEDANPNWNAKRAVNDLARTFPTAWTPAAGTPAAGSESSIYDWN